MPAKRFLLRLPVFAFFFLLFHIHSVSGAESLCAEVRITISQEVAFERQGFEAHMKINNGLEGVDITDLGVQVMFTDADGSEIQASSNPDDPNPDVRFFIRLDDEQTNIGGNVESGSATVPGSTSADIYWRIIPTHDDDNISPEGKLYYVGAKLNYKLGGKDNETVVTPDFIRVKPTPLMTLDYFLPQVGNGDDPNTRIIEPSTPFSLGVRVRNDGFGKAGNFSIESAQPKIANNELGLLIGFSILGSEVDGLDAGPSLKVNFGDIEPHEVSCARWRMETTLSGEFKDFTAEFKHADELGGSLTSLIQAVNTHTLVRDVRVDSPGSDAIRDFLCSDNPGYSLYDSVNADPETVSDQSSLATFPLSGTNGSEEIRRLSFPQTAGHAYAKVSDPYAGEKMIKRAYRLDGKRILDDNVWLSRLPDGSGGWIHYVNIFDSNTDGQYDLVFDNPENLPHAPVLQYITDKTVAPANQLSFIVEATDQDGDPVTIGSSTLPNGASFAFDEIRDQVYVYVFDWTPTQDDIGVYPITFTASDGVLTHSRSMKITVGGGGYTLTVNEGSGGGNYPPGEIVPIAGNPPSDGMVFDQWTAGDTTMISDVNAINATLTMPESDLTVTATYKSSDFSDPLLVHWALNETQPGVVLDLSSYKFHGSVNSEVVWIDDGVVDGALEFDGIDDKVTSNFSRDLANWTISTWVKSSAAPSDAANNSLINRKKNFQINWDHSEPAYRGAARLSVAGEWHSASFGELLPDTWYFLCATYDGETLKTYKNGIAANANDAPSGAPDSETATLALGSNSDGTEFFSGVLDDVRVYQTVLDANQLVSLFQEGTGLVALADTYNVAEDDVLTINAETGLLANDLSDEYAVVTASVSNGPSNGTLALNEDGSFEYSPNENFSGQDSFVYSISDSRFSSSAAVTISVEGINDAPTVVADAYTVLEDGVLTVAAETGVLSNDEDIDGDVLTAELEAGATNGVLVLNPDGSFEYSPNENFNGVDSFTYKAKDASVYSELITVAITVESVNDVPVANADSYSTPEDQVLAVPVELGLLANDEDADGESLTVELVDDVNTGTLDLAQNGSFTYTPPLNFNGDVAFTYKAKDEAAYSTVATVSITVTSENDAPVANSDSFSAMEDETLSVAVASGLLVNDTDIDGDQLTTVLVNPPVSGALNLNTNGSFTYQPMSNFNGVDTFTYKAYDGDLHSGETSVTIVVAPKNDLPVANADSYAVNEDDALLIVAALGVLSNDTDIDGDSLTAILTNNVSHGSLNLNSDGSFTYQASSNFNGQDSFSYKANDSTGDSNEVLVTITVNSINDAPTAASDTYQVVEDETLTIQAAQGVFANDADIDGDTLTAILTSDVSHGALSLNSDGSFVYQPSSNFNGQDSFSYKANDSIAASNEVLVTITVDPLNDAPTASADEYQVVEDETLTIQVAQGVLANDADVDDDDLIAVLTNDVSHGTLTFNADGSFEYQPEENFNGQDFFSYKANDSTVDSNEVLVTITVNSVNDAPIAISDAYQVVEGETLTIQAPEGVLANDSDVEEDELTAILVTNVTNGTLNLNSDGSFEYIPNPDFNGDDSFTYKANDGALDSQNVSVAITVAPKPTAILSIAVNPVDGGNTSPEPGTHVVDKNEPIAVTAAAADGYIFDGWTTTGAASIENPAFPNTSVTLTDDGEIIANFTPQVETAYLTLAVSPEGAGEVIPSETVSIPIGADYEIRTSPSDDFVFIGWQVNGNAIVADPEALATMVNCSGDATITANYTSTFQASGFDKVVIELDDRGANRDSATVFKAELPDFITPDDIGTQANFSFKVKIDDRELILDDSNSRLWVMKDKYLCFSKFMINRWCFFYKTLLTLDFKDGKRRWSFRTCRANFDSDIDGTDGVGIYLTVGGKTIGGNIEMDETVQWSFGKRDLSTPFPIDGDPFDKFTIKEACGKSYGTKVGHDHFRIRKGEIGKMSGFNPNSGVFLSLDSWSVFMDNGRRIGRHSYSYSKTLSDGAFCKISLNLKKGTWEFKLNRASGLNGLIYGDDGIDVILKTNGLAGGLKLDANQKIKLKYGYK